MNEQADIQDRLVQAFQKLKEAECLKSREFQNGWALVEEVIDLHIQLSLSHKKEENAFESLGELRALMTIKSIPEKILSMRAIRVEKIEEKLTESKERGFDITAPEK